MPEAINPYLERTPGDLITAEDWNDVQLRIRRDIGDTTRKAVEEITRVQSAGDAEKLEGKTLAELTDEVVRRCIQEVRAESGYQQLFKVLRVDEDNVVEHGLHLCPLVDLYQLDYFRVVCCEDKDTFPTWTTFYLQHECEKRLRYNFEDKRGSLPVQPDSDPLFKVPFREMLARYRVEYDDDSSLSDVENDFWAAFNSAPNDRFSDDQHCHSPWFDRCCREEKTVGEAKRNGDWEDLWIQFRARKTVNFPAGVDTDSGATPAPTQVQVTHHDPDTLVLRLLDEPVYPTEVGEQEEGAAGDEKDPVGPLGGHIAGYRGELKLMVLLKV